MRSTWLQRRLRIGYYAVTRLMERQEREGEISPPPMFDWKRRR